MGSKSSKVAPPDPRLVQAQIKSMGIQDAAITQVMQLAKEQQAQNAELMPLQKQQLQFGLDTAKTAYDQSQSDRTWLLGRRDELTGLQDKMIGEAAEFNTGAEGERRANAYQTDVSKSYTDIQAANDRAMAGMGIAPGSGRFQSARAGVDLARTLAGAANQGRTEARTEGRMLVDRANNALAGYPAAATGVTGQGAALGASGVSTANAGVGGINAGYGAMTGQQQAAAGIAGSMGSNATGMWGAQANYKLQSDQAANDLGGIGTLVGAGLGAYSKFSSRDYKQDIERVGSHPLGIGLYRFRYRPAFRAKMGAGWHEGVMADEVAQVLPEAVGRDADGYTFVNYSML
jgi:hypothetical protein